MPDLLKRRPASPASRFLLGKTWPDLKEVAYEGDKQILPLTGGPDLPALFGLSPLLVGALLVVLAGA